MKIVYHIGANGTDGDKLVRSLVKNSKAMADKGVSIPLPGKYRRLLRETIQNLGGGAPAPDTRDILLDAIMDDGPADRIVMSNSAYICLPVRVFEAGEFYGLLTMKMRALTQLFPEDDLDIHFAVRNPATFVPTLWSQVKNRPFNAFMGGVDPRTLRWSEVIRRIRLAAPTAKLTVWCNEDTPMLWGDILRGMIGLEENVPVAGENDLLATIMSADGLARYESYLASHPPQTSLQKRRVIAAFLDKYALPDEVEEEVDLPGWDAALVHELTELYEEDVEKIAKIDGVNFLDP
ncbi:hypothetical protein [Flavimaricola marinus]|uniref:Sulfotransferase domain protein n=1 Tax=Flavimaricola marinus TaxID=1819565 RepID=A0A238LIY7_9RHOB|nr:hypothetical protein [Flavimaricola marinus]SMY09582.1 hypothetical protein LOM8899_03749 [Flavimaricola marinus]